MSKTPYSVAVGYANKSEELPSVDAMTKAAEEMMYKDKSQYYVNSGIERRKA